MASEKEENRIPSTNILIFNEIIECVQYPFAGSLLVAKEGNLIYFEIVAEEVKEHVGAVDGPGAFYMIPNWKELVLGNTDKQRKYPLGINIAEGRKNENSCYARGTGPTRKLVVLPVA